MSCGYIYVASNSVGGMKEHNYVKEAIYSAKSLKKICPNAKITLFTDKELKEDVFDNIEYVDMSLRCKQNCLLKSPYEKTILVDTDTCFNHSIEDLFTMLDKYELCACHCFSRKRKLQIPEYMKIPYAFSEINTGIVAFKKCDNFTNFANLWVKYYEKYKNVTPWDQPTGRVALWESGINVYILPAEYNRRHKGSKDKCVKLRKQGDNRFGEDHLKTRVYHFHGIEKMNKETIENTAQVI
jgi:hypothetical protein